MRILLIEPDNILAATYTQALEQQGHEVVRTASAQAAVHAADERRPDVVVLELQLPRHNGVEFLYEFRSYAEWQAIPVVVHTFVPLNQLQGAATLQKELGVKRLLYKPATSLAQLAAALQSTVPAAS